MVKYYDPAIYGDDPIEPNGCGYEDRLYVTEEDYAALEARVAELEKDAALLQLALEITPGLDEALQEAMIREE